MLSWYPEIPIRPSLLGERTFFSIKEVEPTTNFGRLEDTLSGLIAASTLHCSEKLKGSHCKTLKNSRWCTSTERTVSTQPMWRFELPPKNTSTHERPTWTLSERSVAPGNKACGRAGDADQIPHKLHNVHDFGLLLRAQHLKDLHCKVRRNETQGFSTA